MATLRQDLGPVTAYAYAVSEGYTGTEEEFAEVLANFADSAEQVAADAAQVALDKGAVHDDKEAVDSAEGRVTSAVNTFTTTTAPNAVTAVENAGTAQIGLVEAEGTRQIGLVADKGTEQVGTVSSEGTTQIGLVEAKGAEVIASIPGDYSTLQGDIASTYSSSSTYAVGDYVLYSGQLYRCTTAISTAEAWTSAKWTAVALGDDVSDLKSALDRIKAVTVTAEEASRQEDILPNITWTEGQYVATDGTILANATLKYSNKISVSEGDVIDLRPSNSAFRWVCAYNGSTAVSGSGTQNVATYTVPSGIDSIVVSAYIDASYAPTAIIRSYTEAIYKNIIQVDNLVEKDGTEQVKSSNIFGMSKTDKKTLSDNLFSRARLYASGNYPNYDSVNDVIWLQPNASYDTYIIPVDGISDYIFTFVRFAFLVNSDTYTEVASGIYGNPDPVDGVAIANATCVTATDAKYILFTFAPSSYPSSDYSINRVDDVYDIPNNWNIRTEPNKYLSVSGSIADGGTMQIVGGTAIKDGYAIAFKGFISSFNKVRMRFLSAWDNTETNYIEVDNTNIIVKNSTATALSEAHGLIVTNDFALIVEFIDGNIKVTIESNGSIFAKTYTWYQISATVTYPSVISTGSVFTSAVLNKVYSSAKRDIWYFGDSYISFEDVARWTYYAHEYGYDKNALLSGASGGNTVTAKLALDALVKFGKPKYAVLATGMNDGSDTESAPSSLWTNYKTLFIEVCENNGIEPILCTIPTVPTVNNEQKNAWVKSSGYRYIDFAKAVGASASGVWYGDMLSDDGIHPSVSGAKALFTQVLIDLPEITIE